MPNGHDIPQNADGLPSGAQNLLKPLASKLRKLHADLHTIRDNYDKLNSKFTEFKRYFPKRPMLYITLGILGLTTLYFDILIGFETLFFLADFLNINIILVSIIFAIIDTGVSIITSGYLAIGPVEREGLKKIGQIVLKLLGIIKLTLFIVYMTSFPSIDILTIIINCLFIILIYFLFHITGAGLLYLIGHSWYKLLFFLTLDPIDLERKIQSKCTDFSIKCNTLAVDAQTARTFFHLNNICRTN